MKNSISKKMINPIYDQNFKFNRFMKIRNFWLFLSLLILSISCDRKDGLSDENTTTNNTPILVTKLLTDDGVEFNFKYDSNKILEINTIEEKTIYFYTGELITKSQYLGDFSNGVYYVSELTDYTYDNSGRLSKSVTVTNDTSNNYTNKTTKTTTYSYLSNSLIKITENEDGVINNYDVNTNSDGSVKSWVKTDSKGAKIGNVTIVYDNKNSPFKNIKGFYKIYFFDIQMNSSFQNILEYNYSGDEQRKYKAVYQYNSNNYPTKSINSYYNSNGTIDYTLVLTYQYNHL